MDCLFCLRNPLNEFGQSTVFEYYGMAICHSCVENSTEIRPTEKIPRFEIKYIEADSRMCINGAFNPLECIYYSYVFRQACSKFASTLKALPLPRVGDNAVLALKETYRKKFNIKDPS